MVNHRNYMISDEAWESLKDQAINLGYVNPRSMTHKGLRDYVVALSRCRFLDVREWKDTDIEQLESGAFPFWLEEFSYRDTLPKVLLLPKDCIERLATLTKCYGITRPGQRRFSYIVMASNTLEAIGLDRLVPIDIMPVAKKFRYRRVS